MDDQLKQDFLEKWDRYFPGAELPLTFFYSNDRSGAELVVHQENSQSHNCIILDLARARKGEALCFDGKDALCSGAKRYLGFAEGLRPNFEYFLSCGIPGELEGERYKKSPEIVTELMGKQAKPHAPAEYIVFKRWDLL